MAQIGLRFLRNGQTLIGQETVSDAHADRILAAEAKNMGTSSNQETVNALIKRFLDEMVADTKTVERNATPVADIPRTPG